MSSPTLLKGSFRGVGFGAFNHSMESGRRTAVHEFPFRDTPYVEDLGLKTRSFQLELFTVGSDFTQRDALRKALEAKGPGTLVHPWLGTMTVQVGSFTQSESNDSQRMTSFTVTFIQPGALKFPDANVNPSGTVNSGSTAASLQAGANAGAIDVSTAPALSALQALVSQVSGAVVSAAQQAAQPSSLSTASQTTAAIQAVSSYQAQANGLAALAATPDLMSYSAADVIFQLSGLGMTSLQGFAAYQRLLGTAQAIFAALNYPSSSAGAVAAANAALFQDVVYVAIVGSAASCAVGAAYTTLDQALDTQQALRSMFDAAMLAVTDDTLFGQIQDLRASSLTAIPDPSQSLPNVVSVVIPAPQPSLVLAHDLMGAGTSASSSSSSSTASLTSAEATLITLNAVGNPWFVPGAGSVVSILS